ncbi:MAG TPA: PEP-CTERM sorting domain-containing protein, partial [Bryobacteraceae bacterium]|nr:PEP-CTERM sorting domain-containing protein [Bryobacteraceae bacterium]
FTSQTGEPWGTMGVADYQNAMATVFGTYTTEYYETADASVFNPGTSFVLMEGGAGNDVPLQSYLDTYNILTPDILNWVAAGGRLMIDSAGWDNSIVTGFGDVTLNWDDYVNDESYNGYAVNPTDAIFQGPYTPVGTSWYGNYFSHDTVTGTGLTALITGDTGVGANLAYETFGLGMVVFSGETPPTFQSPQPQVYNLLDNELAFAATGVPIATPEPGSLALFGAGIGSLVALRRRRAGR